MPFQMIIVRVCLCAAVLLLTGCAATIQRETNAGARKIESATYTGVDIVLTDAARRLQADNPQFSVRELGDYVRRRLEATELLNPQGTHRVEVTIESFRVRSAAAAVMLGIMAGTDQIDGYVRVYDARGRQVHGYKVNAHYGLGGWGGGQDGMRMNWLYDKFSELTIAELSGSTPQNAVAKGRAVPAAPSGTAAVSVSATQAGQPVSIAAAPAAPVRRISVGATTPAAEAVTAAVVPSAPAPASTSAGTVPAQAARLDTGFAPLDDIDAIPYLSDRGRKAYAEWLKFPTPRAFAIADNGYFWHTSGLKPKDPTLPTDPVERALRMCENAAKRPCKLYAVNGAVVWPRDPR
jgi:hypothetical protein